MKKVMMIFALALLTVTISNAQDAKQTKTPEERAEKLTKKLTKELDLNETQQTEIKSASVAHFTTMKAKKAELKQLRAVLKEERKSYRDQVKAQLNEDQQVKYDAFLEAKKAKRKAKRQAKLNEGANANE